MASNVKKPGFKFMTTFKVMVVKRKLIVEKYDKQPLISNPDSSSIFLEEVVKLTDFFSF